MRATWWILGLTGALVVACGDDAAPPRPDGGALDAAVDSRATDAGPDTGCGAPGGSLDGWRCRCDDDCTAGAICLVEAVAGDPGGVCQRACDMPGVTCSAGAACRTELPDPLCYAQCTSPADCQAGRVCDGEWCVSRCQADAECLSGHCDPWQAACTDGTPRSGGGLFAACTSHDECRSNLCTEHGCVTLCSLSRDGCPDGAICFGAGDTDSGLCGQPCGTTLDCDDSRLECVGVPAPAGASACVPPTLTD